jgi:hypothetical protein
MAPKASLTLACAGLILAQAAATHADDLVIDHKAVGCIVVGKFPKMNACFSPAPNLARGRVYFRPEGTPSWYYVEMKTDQPCWAGILPKPGKKLVGKKIEYYLEGQDRTFNAARTAEYGPVVVRSAQECKKDVPVAPFLNNATVAVFPSLPAGFAAGSAIGTAAVVAVAGAGVAAGTAAVLASGGNGTTTTTTPSGNTTTTVAAVTTTTTSTTTTTVVANRPPLAILKTNPDPPEGVGPLTVTFDLCSSTDPDGDPLSFFFNFGDGAQASGGCVQSHSYPASSSLRGASAGDEARALDTTYNFEGSVVDTKGASQTRTRKVIVRPPVCEGPRIAIVAPKEADCFPSKMVFVSATASGANKVHFAVDEINCSPPFATTIPDEAFADVVGTSSPYSTTMNVGLPTFECYRLRATAQSTCASADASPIKFIVDTSCGCGCGKPFSREVARWSSDLTMDGGRLEVVMNHTSASFPGRGRAYGVASLVEGENRVEAVLVESAGKPGVWRFDFMNSEAVVPGSLHVVAGDVVSIASSSLTFRLRGESGERIVFTFQKQ